MVDVEADFEQILGLDSGQVLGLAKADFEHGFRFVINLIYLAEI